MSDPIDRLQPILNDTKLQSTNNALYQFLNTTIGILRTILNTISTLSTSSSSTTAGINQLTGDVTAGPGSGSQIATIPNDTITFAKMQNINTQTAIGRNTAGTGDPELVTISQMLDWL